VSEPFRLHTHAKKNNIILGTWYDTVIAPKDCNIEASGYLPGSCPYAERLSAQTVNLPTDIHISENDALQICDIINKYQNL
jgi:dTDP-4-amino-4,6-dideoxygalactose transaminase